MFILKNTYREKNIVREDATIYKKYDHDNLEVNIYVVKPGASFFLMPPKDPKGVKVYLIIKGKISHCTTGNILEKHDTIILRHDDDYFLYDPIEETNLYLTAYGDSSYETTEIKFKAINEAMQKIQVKDDYTNRHCERVLALAKEMAKVLKLTGKEAYNLITAARYHDLGKIAISDHILNKPSRLTLDEFETMKRHVLEGVSLLPDHYNHVVGSIIEEHHERLDGSGYPKGLKGHEISEAGRALAVMDTFDAMTTNRVYKKGKSVGEAFEELYDLADQKYDRKYIQYLEQIIKDNPDLIHR